MRRQRRGGCFRDARIKSINYLNYKANLQDGWVTNKGKNSLFI